jgi:beta-lactamase class C
MRIILFVFMLITATQASSERIQSILPKLESFVKESMRKKKVPGLAIAVVVKGKIVYTRCFGVRTIGQHKPIDEKTIFQLGSVSKPLSSTLIAILARHQKISLDHPIEALPETTLRHVLSHTTGIPSGGFNAMIESGSSPMEIKQKLQEIIQNETQEPPGNKFTYHNAVYNLLTDVIEHQLGTSFESALQTMLFEPLLMTHTSSTWESFSSRDNRASPHVFQKLKGKKGKGHKKIVRVATFRKEYTNFPAAGGLSSNIHDMALFLAAVMGARPDIITPDDLEEFITPIIHTPDQWRRTHKSRDRITKTHYGLGWRHMIFGNHPLVFHGGWVRGFCNTLAFLPSQEVGIVILQNAESSLSNRIAMQFFDWVLGLPFKKWID